MEIKNQSRQFTKQEQYKLTRGTSINVKDAVGVEFPVDGFMLYSEVNSRGENVEVLAVLSKKGEVYSTISATFKREFEFIWELMDGDDFTLRIIGGITKNNRDYVSCELA